MKNEKLMWLQSLRALAAMYVMMFHCIPFWELLDNKILANILISLSSYGYAGVDIFFIISGYVIGLSSHKKIKNINVGFSFLLDRLSRVFLGYWPILFFTIVLSYVGIRPLDNIEQRFLGSFLLLDKGSSINLLGVAWSLSYEITFYILAFIIIFFLGRFSLKKQIFFLVVVIFSYNFYWYSLHRDMIFSGIWPLRYSMSALTIEFLLGLYISTLNLNFLKQKELIPLYGITAIFSFLVGTHNLFFVNYDLFRVCTFGVCGFSLLMISISLELNEIKTIDILNKIGNSSYSLYLLHPLLLSCAGVLIPRDDVLTKNICILLIPIFCVVVSLLWFYFVENKVYQAYKKIRSG